MAIHTKLFLDSDIEKTRLAYNEAADCTVVALAYAMDISYKDAHAMLREMGRKNRRGFKLRLWLDNQCAVSRMKNQPFLLGKYKVVRVVLPFHARPTLAKFLRDFPRGRFLVRKRGHMFVVINSNVINALTGARTRITNIWYLEEQ